MVRPRFLVVDDGHDLASIVERIIAHVGDVVIGSDLAAARRSCTGIWTGVVLTMRIDGRSTLPLVTAMPPLGRGSCCIVLAAADATATELRTMTVLGVRVLRRPLDVGQLGRDLHRAIAVADAVQRGAEQIVDRFGTLYGWSHELRTLALLTLLGARGRHDIASQTHKSPNTVKHQISSFLQAAGLDDMEGFVRLAQSELLRILAEDRCGAAER